MTILYAYYFLFSVIFSPIFRTCCILVALEIIKRVSIALLYQLCLHQSSASFMLIVKENWVALCALCVDTPFKFLMEAEMLFLLFFFFCKDSGMLAWFIRVLQFSINMLNGQGFVTNGFCLTKNLKSVIHVF